MALALKRKGYTVDRRSKGEILGEPTPGSVAVNYLSGPIQNKDVREYTLGDVLRDRPSKLVLIDMGTGEAAMLSSN